MSDVSESRENLPKKLKVSEPLREDSLFNLTSLGDIVELKPKSGDYPKLSLTETKVPGNRPEIESITRLDEELLFRVQEEVGRTAPYKLTMRLEELHFKPGATPYGETTPQSPWGREYRLFRVTGEKEEEIDYKDSSKRSKLVKAAHRTRNKIMAALNFNDEKGKHIFNSLAKFQKELEIYLL